MITKHRRKAKEAQTLYYDGNLESLFIICRETFVQIMYTSPEGDYVIKIQTELGLVNLNMHDWVVREGDTLYVLTKEAFAKNYESF